MSADFSALPDLASRALSGSVSAANDELFGEFADQAPTASGR